ncbi:hypothetical protein PV04_08056 [Phialophora macrospora]|uniref:Uncharacterized protein n=1 Tax=Phialophora macrospora TaxID=1851006 RepID=A0A0D2FGB6_9EURO|nr:hypothetical protein PV04_08056 [Phialophora macrospora]
MDGGTKQKEMAQRIKAQVKRRADTRREKQIRQLTGSGADTGDGDFILESGQDSVGVHKTSRSRRAQIHATHDINDGSINRFSSNTEAVKGTAEDSNHHPSEDIAALQRQRSSRSTRERAQRSNPTPPRETDKKPWTASVLGFLDDYEEVHDHVPMLGRRRDFDLDFLTKYLDYVFPHLFPFYRPGLHETGRSWVLALLRRSRVAFHSALSLSAYFFTFTLIDAYPGQHGACKGQLWEKVGRQTDMCFEMIQHDIRDLSVRGSRATLPEKVRVMESIVQFLIFELAVGRSANWDLHLTPAIALFEEIWQSAGTTVDEEGGSESQLLAVLDAMAPPLRFGLERGGYYIWSPEQAGLRFFTGLLVFIDIVASTALERPPRLAEHHAHLLADQDDGVREFGTVPVQLSGLVGCQNWVLLAISRITLLDGWKKMEMEMNTTAGRSTMDSLGDRAAPISRTLKDGISRLAQQPTADPGRINPLDFRSYFNALGQSPPSATSSSTILTKIWAHAAQIYLAVVVSGFQPSHAEIRSSVSRVLELLQTVDCATHLRTLAWPLCVAGCMAEAGGHELQFRDLFARVDELSMVGALGEARKIMETAWQTRESLDRGPSDLAACFRILGAPVLLV